MGKVLHEVCQVGDPYDQKEVKSRMETVNPWFFTQILGIYSTECDKSGQIGQSGLYTHRLKNKHKVLL